MSLMTKEQYEDWINRLDSEDRNIKPQWSQPMYICPKCGGGMCKNLWTRTFMKTMKLMKKKLMSGNKRE